MPDRPPIEWVQLRITRAAAENLLNWLASVPDSAIPVTHPAERQALADLLNCLESTVEAPDPAGLDAARKHILRDSGTWVNEGPIYKPST